MDLTNFNVDASNEGKSVVEPSMTRSALARRRRRTNRR